METVALEWISSSEVEPRDVVQLVQQLNNVPEEAVCEVGDIFSRRCRATGLTFGNDNTRQTRNEVHLSCEPRVAEFLCKKFGKQTQHVTGGEVIRVRCKRVYPGAKPLGKLVVSSSEREMSARGDQEIDDATSQANTQPEDASSSIPILPIEKVIALIDLLGDKVVDAHEAYELFADADARQPQRMTMLGLTKALARLCKNEWTTKSSDAKIVVERLHHLLTKLIASKNVGVRRLPSATTVPFLSYTDFLACYVAYLASLHSPS
ncbi:Zinc finger, RING/FYVE/PHD-type [Phytophthora cinnamomi]|uniref:Zinc finger, RING/FYVE/PHD-type n=1 Tax=Phytophthora cinnamomi TaxID=4785 RepID=UPI00355A17A4|nr:Zinc finger, RING/FYVE/PHD-type [Phytophthora cinnamomi]